IPAVHVAVDNSLSTTIEAIVGVATRTIPATTSRHRDTSSIPVTVAATDSMNRVGSSLPPDSAISTSVVDPTTGARVPIVGRIAQISQHSAPSDATAVSPGEPESTIAAPTTLAAAATGASRRMPASA